MKLFDDMAQIHFFVEDDAFGDFRFDVFWIDAGFLDGIFKIQEEIRVIEVNPGEIDADRKDFTAFSESFLDVRKDLLEDEEIQLDDETVSFRDIDEGLGVDVSFGVALPFCQGLTCCEPVLM